MPTIDGRKITHTSSGKLHLCRFWRSVEIPTVNIREKIRLRLGALGISARKASVDAGLGTHFLQNFLAGRSESMRAENLQRIARVLDCAPSWLMEDDHDFAKNSSDPVNTDRIPLRRLPIRGIVAQGEWHDLGDDVLNTDVEVLETVPVVAPPGYENANLYGLRTRGRSMDLEYPDGCVLIVCPTSDTDAREGDNVIVLRRKSGLAETTCKSLVQINDRWALQGKSTEPAFNEPWFIEDEGDDTPEIIGVVLGFFKDTKRPPRRPTVFKGVTR